MVVALVFLTPALLSAQTPKWSLGATMLGVGYETESELLTAFVPGGGSNFGFPSVFAGIFASENIVIRPGLNFNLVSNGGTLYDIAFEAQVEYHFSGVMVNSPYLFAGGVFNAFGNGVSETDFAAGGGVGYRMLPYDFWALMFEASFRRWFDFEANQITGTIKMEVVIN
jgi:hypothetical protein